MDGQEQIHPSNGTCEVPDGVIHHRENSADWNTNDTSILKVGEALNGQQPQPVAVEVD